jgi:hypothetical protein
MTEVVHSVYATWRCVRVFLCSLIVVTTHTFIAGPKGVANAQDFTPAFRVQVKVTRCDCYSTETEIFPLARDFRSRKILPVVDVLKLMQRDLKRIPTKRRAALQAALNKTRQLRRVCTQPCIVTGALLGFPRAPDSPPDSGGPLPTPTPTITATATPSATRTPPAQATATPTPPSGCFSSGGDTGCFGIPIGVQGNIDRGAAFWTANSCSGCHTEVSRRGRDYSAIQAAFSNSAMSSFQTPSQQSLADITAYLNRFRRSE